MIDAKTVEELRGLLAADTSTDWQTIRAEAAESQLSALRAENERLRKVLLRLQTGAAVALDALPEDQQEGVVGNFLAAIHRECCAGLCASKGADECKEATP